METSARAPGFTIIELILVMVLVGALAVFALPSFFNRAQFDEYAYYQRLIGATRFAQKTAVATGCDVQMDIQASGFQLRFRAGAADEQSCGPPGAAFSVALIDPASSGSAYTVPAPSGVAIGNLTRYFDAEGRPRDAAGVEAGGSVAVGARTLTIETGTGYVH